MKTQTNPTGLPVGIRFSFLLIPLFAAVVLGTSALAYPAQIETALGQLHASAPLANPTLTVSSGDGSPLSPAPEVLSALRAVGTTTQVDLYDTETADGIRIRLLSFEDGMTDGAFTLKDGRMPQNSTECVVVFLNSAAQNRDLPYNAYTGVGIGSAIRPCGEDGTVLISGQNNSPCMLTVVGIGENALSALAPVSDNDVHMLVYTTSADSWHNPDMTAQLYLTDCTADDPIAAVQSVLDSTAALQQAYRTARADEQLVHCSAAAEEADQAILSHQITVQEIENRLDTANLRVTEAENNMMNAIAVLQAEQQAFVSDMEYNEYYALRQVDLIPRRDRAEEGYAKQEAAIAQMYDALQAAYDDRDAIRAELDHANALLISLQADADLVHTELETQQRLTEQSARTQVWNITTAEQHSGYAALRSHTATIRNMALLMSAIALSIYLVGSITLYAVSQSVTYSAFRTLFSAVLIAVPAIFFGGCLLTKRIFDYSYPALRDTLIIPLSIGDILITGSFILLFSALIGAGISAVGRRLQQFHISATNK